MLRDDVDDTLLGVAHVDEGISRPSRRMPKPHDKSGRIMAKEIEPAERSKIRRRAVRGEGADEGNGAGSYGGEEEPVVEHLVAMLCVRVDQRVALGVFVMV